jgi:hypothetical protein
MFLYENNSRVLKIWVGPYNKGNNNFIWRKGKVDKLKLVLSYYLDGLKSEDLSIFI